MANVDLLVIQQHTIDGFDSRLCSFGAVIVNEAVTLGASALVCRDLARKNVTESGEGIMKSLGMQSQTEQVTQWTSGRIHYLVVNLLVEVLDENVALTRLAEGWVSLRPHDTARRQDVGPGIGKVYRWRPRTRLCP